LAKLILKRNWSFCRWLQLLTSEHRWLSFGDNLYTSTGAYTFQMNVCTAKGFFVGDILHSHFNCIASDGICETSRLAVCWPVVIKMDAR